MKEYADILNRDDLFRYQMLGRLQGDCNYYLGYGNRNPRVLWAQDAKSQIDLMKALWDTFTLNGKPEWLTKEDIKKLEKEMLG